MSDEPRQASNGLLLFLLGAAVGAAAVALLTPKTGPELRADLKDKAKAMKDKAMDAMREGLDGAV